MRNLRINLLVIGLLIGSGLGLLTGWVIYPLGSPDAKPATLRADYQEMYMLMVAAAYRSDSNLERASTRLDSLELNDPASAVTSLAQRAVDQQRNNFTTETISDLALALGGGTKSEDIPRQATASEQPTVTSREDVLARATLTSIATMTPLPIAIPIATPAYDYVLLSQERVCDSTLHNPLIQAQVLDQASQPLPGIRVVITWTDGRDEFFTGLKPELGQGYGDFTMKPGQVYSVQVGSMTMPLEGVISEQCTDSGTSYPGSVMVRWQRAG